MPSNAKYINWHVVSGSMYQLGGPFWTAWSRGVNKSLLAHQTRAAGPDRGGWTRTQSLSVVAETARNVRSLGAPIQHVFWAGSR